MFPFMVLFKKSTNISKCPDLQVFLILDTSAVPSSPYHQTPAASPERCC